MEHKIYDIFPTPVMKFNFGREFTKDELDFIYKSEDNCHKNSGNKSSNDTYILNNNQLNDISNFCQNASKVFFEKIYNPINDVEIYITQSWLNWTYSNEYHHTHAHPNSIISGVFYINADKSFDNITFGKHNYKMIEMYPKAYNDYNTDEVDFKVKTGELLLFPSNLQHRVNTTKGNTSRISLAFNTFVKGNFGNLRALNYLKL
jgi:uncharacterized protein (TIGR02466 family)